MLSMKMGVRRVSDFHTPVISWHVVNDEPSNFGFYYTVLFSCSVCGYGEEIVMRARDKFDFHVGKPEYDRFATAHRYFLEYPQED